ncbi:MAG: ABC transporter permease [Saprospiraceae bacterium]|nr:ABC transporter permease [Saprospiraceae bacterium]
MKKLGIIIRREYLTRVTRRSFIIATFLTPLGFALLFVVVGVIFSYQSDDERKVAIIDYDNILRGSIKDENNLYFKFVQDDLDEMKTRIDDTDFDGILVLPALKDLYVGRYTAFYYSEKQPTPDIELAIKARLSTAMRDYKIDSLQLDRKLLEALDTRIELDPEPLRETGQDASVLTSAIASGIGFIMGIIMYMAVFIYGMMIMRSVMEEKTTRIVEVMISSVRPFELMLGKIIGVGAVGLTQFAIWAILIPLISMGASFVFGIDSNRFDASTMSAAEIDPDDMQAMIGLAMHELGNQNWWFLIPAFIFYFLGGYFLYASLFAAVGSAMGDDLGEGQALTIPITIPVLLAFYIMMAAVQAPNSSLAVWSSIFPLFSPIVMPARLAFSPPLWEVALSMVVLAASSVFFVWLSGRIYRVGILMYGKKVTLKELGKWMFYKD